MNVKWPNDFYSNREVATVYDDVKSAYRPVRYFIHWKL